MKIFLLGISALLLISFTSGSNSKIIDYLSIGDTMIFNDEEYILKWSSHPSGNYYKQEYLRKEDNLKKFQKMVIVESIKGDLTVNEAAGVKIQELEKWKKENPVVNYQRFDNEEKNESMVDFVVSDGASIYEWNVYRYQQQNNNGVNYLVLYAYCYRESLSTSKDLKKFFAFVKENRMDLINKAGSLEMPEVEVKEEEATEE